MATSIMLETRTSVPALAHVIDGYLRDSHAISVGVTDYPVESGTELTDHAVKEPDTLTLEGWVSNIVPVTGVSEEVALDDRAGVAWAAIQELAANLEPVKVTTPLREYENMLLTSARTRQDESTGRGLMFTLSLREVRFSTVLPGEVVGEPESATAERTESTDRGRVPTTETAVEVD